MPSAPAPHNHSGTRTSRRLRDDRSGRRFRLHSSPAMATNQTSTDRSTCTTRATRKKSPDGNHALMPGVRANTSRMENRPEPSSAPSASHSQPRASDRPSAVTAGSSKRAGVEAVTGSARAAGDGRGTPSEISVVSAFIAG